MANILVIEDDHSTQLLIVLALKKDGHQVVTCSDGTQGLIKLHEIEPDILICDVTLPGMDGFTLVREIRKSERWISLPIVFLTSLDQRTHVRVGMSAGADDYISKPFSLAELREAVQIQLRKREQLLQLKNEAVTSAVEEAKDELAVKYEKKLIEEVDRYWKNSSTQWEGTGKPATVVYAGMRNYMRYAEVLPGSVLKDMVERYYETCLDAVELFGASSTQFFGDGMLAVYSPEGDTQSQTHQMRAWRAATGLLSVGGRLKGIYDAKLKDLGLPLFETTVALHEGEVHLVGVTGFSGKTTPAVPVGDAVNTVCELHKKISPLWAITATQGLAEKLDAVAAIRQKTVLNLPPRFHPITACELVPLRLTPGN